MNNQSKLMAAIAVAVAVLGCSVVMLEETDAKASTVYVGGPDASDDTGDGTSDAPFASVTKALSSTSSGGTIVFLGNVETTSFMVEKTSLCIDLGGFTLTIAGDSQSSGISFFGSTFEIRNGTIIDERDTEKSGGYRTISLGAGQNLTVTGVEVVIYDSLNSSSSNNTGYVANPGSTLTLIDSKITSVPAQDADSGSVGIVVLGTGNMTNTTTLSIQGTTSISVGQFGISGNGSIVNDDGTSSGGDDTGVSVSVGKDYRGTTISIQDEARIEARNGWGIYHPQDGTLTISDEAVVSGLTGIEMRSGTLEIDGGTVMSTAEVTNSQPNEGGPTTVGAAIAIVQHTTKLDLNIGIHDGATVSGPTGLYQADLQGNGSDGISKISILIDGGNFTSTVAGENAKAVDAQDVTGFIIGGDFDGSVTEGAIKTGYSMENGSIIADNPVANIGNRTFSSLLDAIHAAGNGDTIEFTGYTAAISSALVIDKSVNIVFAGSQNQQITINGTFTGPGIMFTSGSSSISGNGMIVDNRGYNGGSGFSAIVVEGPNTSLTYSSKLQSYAPSTGYNGNLAFEVADGAELVLDDAVITEISFPQANSSNGGVGVFGPGESGKNNPTKLIVRGNTTINVGGFAIFGNGSTIDSDTSKDSRYTEIVIEGGTIMSSGATAIYHPQLGDLTITGGEIRGPGAVEFRAGNLIISGNPVITSTETTLLENTETPGSGNSIYGAAIAISQHSTDFGINVSISGGTFVGAYAFYEKDLINDDSDNIAATISGGTFIGSTGSAFSENMTGFISGGTYLRGSGDSNEPDTSLNETYLTDNSKIDLETGSVVETVTVTFDMPDGNDREYEITKGTTVPEVPEAPVGYSVSFTVNGTVWDPTSEIYEDANVIVSYILNEPVLTIDSVVEGIDATVTVSAESAADVTYTYSAIGPNGDNVEIVNGSFTTQYPGTYTVSVTADGEYDEADATGTIDITFESQTTSDNEIYVDIEQGSTVTSVTVGGIEMDFENVSYGNLHVTITEIETAELEGYGTSNLAYDISVRGSSVNGDETITVCIPVVVPDGRHIVEGSAVVLFVPEDGDPENMNAYIGADGSSIVFTTTHNSAYHVFYDVETDLPPFIPFPPQQGGDPVEVWPPEDGWPTTTGGDDSGSDTLKVVACAAAVVIAALLIVVWASTYRKN